MNELLVKDLKNGSDILLKQAHELNQKLVPMLGDIPTANEWCKLISLSSNSYFIENKQGLVGFIVCFREKSDYQSRNYIHFNNHLEKFIYVDRIGIAKELENKGFGTTLYRYIIKKYGNQMKICAEINTKPMNKKSISFHEKHGFKRVSEKIFNENYEVVYMERDEG